MKMIVSRRSNAARRSWLRELGEFGVSTKNDGKSEQISFCRMRCDGMFLEVRMENSTFSKMQIHALW